METIIRKYLENRTSKKPDQIDLTDHFNTMAGLLWGVLKRFTQGYDDIVEAASTGSQSGPVFSSLTTETKPTDSDHHEGFPSIIEDDIFPAIMDEILSDNYQPPFENATGLQIHMITLWEFFSAITSFDDALEIDFEIILKLDRAAMQLLSISAAMAELMRPAAATKRRTRTATGKNLERAQRNRDAVLRGLRHLGAKVRNEAGKLFIETGENRKPINQVMPDLQKAIAPHYGGMMMDPQTIKKHLLEIEKTGNI